MQKAFVVAFVAFISWMGFTVYNMSVDQAVMASKLDAVVSAAGDRYTSTQAATDKQGFITRMEAAERRLDRLEAKHSL